MLITLALVAVFVSVSEAQKKSELRLIFIPHKFEYLQYLKLLN